LTFERGLGDAPDAPRDLAVRTAAGASSQAELHAEAAQ
jgi:hypothetical protein